ncbi:hypothetical protein [Nocardioides sp.]|uniref:hypothetical protein n=1 Tax=Nocardioides sp. TaxID=35761 RepID=UPI00378392CF
MTPFMMRVADLVGAEGDPEVTPMPLTRISQRIATSTGADRQVAVRSLAEQLVCEANAVLSASDDHLTLSDETLPQELAFSVGYRGRAARVSTTFEDGTAYGRLVGDGFESELPVELDGPDALPDLLVRLLVESGLPHHPVPTV